MSEGDRQVLLTLALPLSLTLMADLLKGIGDAAERAGYTDVALLTDGTNRIVGRPPTRRCSRIDCDHKHCGGRP